MFAWVAITDIKKLSGFTPRRSGRKLNLIKCYASLTGFKIYSHRDMIRWLLPAPRIAKHSRTDQRGL